MKHVAVIGAGNWGRNLIRNFHELGALKTISDSDSSKLRTLWEKYPSIEVTEQIDQVLADSEIDGVVIATNAEHHARIAESALLAGKDCFVEKPLALRYADGERIVHLAQKQNRILMVGHLLEYHPAIKKLQSLVGGGELGKIQYVYSNRLNLGRVRREENILWSFAPHDIAILLRLIGDLPLEVVATGGSYLQPNIADVTVTNLLFDHGVRAHIFVSWLHPYKEHRLVVVGSAKMASFNDGEQSNKLVIYDQDIQWINGQPVPQKRPGVNVTFDDVEPLRVECQHFLECIQTRQTPRTDGFHGLQVLTVLQAAQRSLQTHGQPVLITGARLELANL